MYFQFNQHSSLLLPFVVQGLLYVILFLYRARSESNLADFFLALLTYWSTSHVAGWMLGFAGWYDSADSYTQFMFYFPFSTWFVLGPLIYFFIKAKTNAQFNMRKKDWLHFIIPGLSILWILICFFIDIIYTKGILGESLPEYNGTRGPFAQSPFFFLTDLLNVLRYTLLFYYLYLSFRHFRGYQKYIVSELSIAEEVEFKWVRNILFALAGVILFWFIFDMAGLFIENRSYGDIWWGYLVWGIIIFYISIIGYKDVSHLNNQVEYDPFSTLELQNIPEEKEPSTSQKDESLPILDHLNTKKSFLKPNLSLSELAKELKTSPSVLSKTLNANFNQNFNEFINEFRIKEVVQKLTDPEFSHYSILGIALECGFNSKATFNRVFKAQTGLSPSQYKKELVKDH